MTPAEAAKANAFYERLLIAVSSAISSGKSVSEAFDKVAGDGAWDWFVSDLYDALRAKSVAA